MKLSFFIFLIENIINTYNQAIEKADKKSVLSILLLLFISFKTDLPTLALPNTNSMEKCLVNLYTILGLT